LHIRFFSDVFAFALSTFTYAATAWRPERRIATTVPAADYRLPIPCGDEEAIDVGIDRAGVGDRHRPVQEREDR
jgi:hypothetical protein